LHLRIGDISLAGWAMPPAVRNIEMLITEAVFNRWTVAIDCFARLVPTIRAFAMIIENGSAVSAVVYAIIR
jgi:hypothetical protein